MIMIQNIFFTQIKYIKISTYHYLKMSVSIFKTYDGEYFASLKPFDIYYAVLVISDEYLRKNNLIDKPYIQGWNSLKCIASEYAYEIPFHVFHDIFWEAIVKRQE